MEDPELADKWFPQGGVIYLTARETIDQLGGCTQFISCDLMALYNFCEANIDKFIREIPADMLKRVCQKWTQH